MRKIYPIVFLVLLSLAVSISAFTLDNPSTGDTIGSETILLSANSTALHNQTNITFYALCSDTANSSWVEIGTNGTTGPVQNATLNWTVGDLEDSSSCSFKATSGNDTSETDTNTGITIDRTIPIAPSSVSPSNDETLSSGTFTLTSTVTGSKTTSCTVAWEDNTPTGGSPDTMTHSGDTCSISYTSILDGVYYYTITASDGENTTAGTKTKFEIGTGGTTGAAIAAMQDDASGDSSSTGTVLVIIAVIVGLVIYSNKK